MANYAIIFSAEGEDLKLLLEYFKTRLSRADCEVHEIEGKEEVLAVHVTAKALLVEASKAKLTKKTVDNEDKDFDIKKKEDFKGVDREDFLLSFEKHHLLGAMLDRLQVCGDFMELCKKLKKDEDLIGPSESLILACKRFGFVEYMTPIHNARQMENLWDSAKKHLFTPVDEVRAYFGEQVAYYYAWMNFYTSCLAVPALVGALVFLVNSNQGLTIEESPYVPFFSIFIILWSGLFLKFWRRRAVNWAYKWDTLDLSRKEVSRPEFKGIPRKSPITDKKELYYPAIYRFLKCCVSAIVTLCVLCVVFAVMAVYLNLLGYVRKESTFFYIPYVASFAEPGAIFDPMNTVLCTIPVLVRVFTIQAMNKTYRRVAEVLTNWENHRTEQHYESSLILKRFFFDAFDSYITLFYLAFVERDVLKVRLELTSAYMSDCLRRLIFEVVVPWVLKYLAKRRLRESMKQSKAQTGEKTKVDQELLDMNLDPYEEFDDYLEMIIAYGYITMFASAIPVAAFVQIIYNCVEMKSDIFKLCFVVQRPRVVREKGIGSWRLVMQLQAWLSIFTNLGMFFIMSEPLREFCLYKDGCVYLSMFGLEHALLVLLFLIFYAFADTPRKVDIALKRKQYLLEQKED